MPYATAQVCALRPRDTPRFQPGPPLIERGRGCSKLGRVGYQPCEDEHARKVARERLGHAEHRLDACLVGDRDEDRPLGRFSTGGAGLLVQIE